MAVRAAHVIYDDQRDATAAAAARNELTHQIFTKTMTIQVWKPEFERPGRHFVFTTRYVYFFVALLDQLDDRASLDQLLRRVRKKQGDFINHTKLWEDICLTYARVRALSVQYDTTFITNHRQQVIRRAGNVSEGHEEGVFRPIGWEEFVANTARLENLPQLVPQSIPILELLRDAIELKKLNNHLLKATLLEDLVADMYSRVYELNIPQFVEQVNEENSNKMKVDHLLMTTDGAADNPTPPNSGPNSEAPAPRGRTKGIARRDIQKRAEAIVARRLTSRPLPAKPAAEPTTQPFVTSAPSSNAPHPAPETPHGDHVEESMSAQQSDIPGSLHDSADDESELSEIDDEKLSKLAAERRLLFPNSHEVPADPGSELSGHVSFDGGDVEAEGEAEEGEGEKEANLGGGEDETMGEAGDEGEGDEAEIEGEGGEGDGDGADEEGAGETEVAGEEEGEGEADTKDAEDAGEDMEADQPVLPDAATADGQPWPMDTQPSEP